MSEPASASDPSNSRPLSSSLDPSPLPEQASGETARLIGAHMPTAGGLQNSLIAGKNIGCTVVQLFTGSPRQWSHPPLTDEEIKAFWDAKAKTGITATVAHDSYLINLASPAPDLLDRSQNAFRGELDRAHVLGIPWVVTHMGAHLDEGEEAATARLIASLRQILEETDREGYQVGVALETTAGQGTGLGWRFEEIGAVLAGVGNHPRLGVCLDTCHVFAAGYDLRDEAGYQAVWQAFDANIGLANLKVIHANDSKKPLGSRVDRHAHIGEGEIGVGAFARLMTDSRFCKLPIIIETPDSDTMHAVNLARLQRLASGGALGMLVTVQFFGHYSDYYGGQPLEMNLPTGATVRELVALLATKDARLAQLAAHCRFAVNEEYADLECVLVEGAEVAVLPPMSGG